MNPSNLKPGMSGILSSLQALVMLLGLFILPLSALAQSGTDMSDAISAGSFSSSGGSPFTDFRNNEFYNGIWYSNNYNDVAYPNNFPQSSPDVWYTFTVADFTDIEISLCGSTYDTYVHLIDEFGNEVTHNDDDQVGTCGLQSYISYPNLTAGIYYVVVEGWQESMGDFSLLINSLSSAPSTQVTISYPSTAETFTSGVAITPVVPTISNAPAFDRQITTTYAGSGGQGSTDGSATTATFDWPLHAVMDGAGNLYVPDSRNQRIRKISSAGVVSSLAGSGWAGFSNGTGTGASFRNPAAVAVDASGNVYVADQQNHSIRKITPAGVVTTLAGNGTAGFADGTGSAARFNLPAGITIDPSGNVYVGDAGNHRIRKITPSGVVSTYAGTGAIGATNGAAASATFKDPRGLIFGPAGNLIVCDRQNYRVRSISSSGIVSTLAGSGLSGWIDGTATSARFGGPNSAAMDESGNLYIVDQGGNHMIRKIAPDGMVSTFAGSNTTGSADGSGSAVRFNTPYGICAGPGGVLYVADTYNNKIRKMITRPLSITPALPAGLVFNNSNGTISGTATGPSPATVYTISGYNVSTTLSITVSGSSCAALASFPSQDQNYIVTYSPRTPLTDASQLSNQSVCDVNQTIQYFDGLGRPLQTVQTKASPNKDKDIVLPVEYDSYGREVKKYLAYASTSNDGSYKADALSPGAGVFNFYNPTGSSGTQLSNGVARIPYPVAETKFEPSPLNRVEQQGAPGDAWQLVGTSGAINAGHTVKNFYETNIAGEVSRWNISGTGAFINGSYSANMLYKTRMTDENGNETVEYKDLQGRVILKKVQDGPGTYGSTHYVYDDFGNLRFVIPPKVTVSTFDENTPEFNTLIYGYRYDERNRLVKKKIPGKGWESLVYNILDQIVATRDAVQASGNLYTFTKYDGFGRVTMTGEVYEARSPETLQNDLKQQGISFGTNWETPNNSFTEGYTQSSYPGSWNKLYTVNYYDDYTYPGNPYGSTATGITTRTKGLLTASKVRNLETGAMLWTVNYYNEEGRLRESIVQNHIGGADRIVNEYEFTGELKKSIRTHGSSSVSSLVITNEFKYDHVGRKKQSWQQTGAGNTNVMLSQLDYNEIGQLYQKKLHSEDGANFIEPITYKYNPRGWLTEISSDKMKETLFYEQLSSTLAGAQASYNGNISESWFNTPNRGDRRFYYKYDDANRLKESRYHAGQSHTGELDEQISYDKMGNIENLIRGNVGLPFTHSGTFAYTTPANQLTSVTNNGNSYRTYSYDLNGNVKNDGALEFDYNELNLPKYVKQNGTPVVSYTYTATGQKLRRSSGQTGVTDYISGIQYSNNGSTIDFIQTEEGRYDYSSGKYQYNLMDHLGNVRVMIDKSTATSSTAVQETEYYAFGLNVNRTNVSPDNKYLYNGKEMQNDYNLNQYDYGARFYDPVVARWKVIDPLAEQYQSLSPYNYTDNNPVNNLDPNGMEIIYGVAAENAFRKIQEEEKQREVEANLSTTSACKRCPQNGGQTSAGNKEKSGANEGGERIYGGDGSGSFMDNTYKVLDVLNQYNPIANLMDVGAYAFTGADRFGNKMSLTEANLKAVSVAPIGKLGGAAYNGLSNGLKSLFKQGVSNNSIINIRSTLLSNGFTQGVTRNGKGYLFTNSVGEQVRIMRRSGGWDVRIMNGYGNYLNGLGKVTGPAGSHGISIFSK